MEAINERLSFPPLIEELKENADLYNRQFEAISLVNGSIDAKLIHHWMIHVVQDIVAVQFKALDKNWDKPTFIKTLYMHALSLLSTGFAISFEDEYKAAFAIMKRDSVCCRKYPGKSLSLIFEAILKIRRHCPNRVIEWIGLLDHSMESISNTKQLKSCCKIFAWYCGLAHLKTNALEEWEIIPRALQDAISQITHHKLWGKKNNTQQFNVVFGGYLEASGQFARPPILSQIDNTVIANDQENYYACFVDQFGKVILPLRQFNKNEFEIAFKEQDKNLNSNFIELMNLGIPRGNFSSVIKKDDKVLFTLSDSFFIFTYNLAAS